MEEWGLGSANLGRKARANACESVEKMKARVQTDRNGRGGISAAISSSK